MTNPVAITTNTNDHFLTREEAAAVLKVSLRQVDALMAKGVIPYLKLGGTVRIALDDLKHLPRAERPSGKEKWYSE